MSFIKQDYLKTIGNMVTFSFTVNLPKKTMRYLTGNLYNNELKMKHRPMKRAQALRKIKRRAVFIGYVENIPVYAEVVK